MAFIELTKENNPKLAVQVNNSLKYQDKDGNLQNRQKLTALIDIVKEAGTVASMKKGAVSLSLNTQNGYKNYFVNKTDKDDIALVPMDNKLQADKDNYIYFIKKVNINDPGKYFYNMSKAGNAEEVVNSIKVNETDKSSYLGARVTLSNKELFQDMVKIENETGERHTAILGKDTLNIVTNAELQQRKEIKSQEQTVQQKEIPVEIQNENGKVVDTTTTKIISKENEEPKKSYKPKNKSTKQKYLELER